MGTSVLVTAPFTVVRKWVSLDVHQQIIMNNDNNRWMMKTWSIFTTEFYSATNENEIMKLAGNG